MHLVVRCVPFLRILSPEDLRIQVSQMFRFRSKILCAAAATATPSSAPKAGSTASDMSDGGKKLTEEQEKAAFVAAIRDKDVELLNLKRLHELSILRGSESQRRKKQEYEERAIFYDEMMTKTTLDMAGTHHRTKENVEELAGEKHSLRTWKLVTILVFAFGCDLYLTYRYAWNSKRHYTSRPRTIWGSEAYDQNFYGR